MDATVSNRTFEEAMEDFEQEADDDTETLENLGFTFDAPPETGPLREPSIETEEASASEFAKERGVLFGDPKNLVFLPLLAVEVDSNEGERYVSTRPTLTEIMAGKDASHGWNPVVAFSRMDMAQQVLLAESSVRIEAAWLADPLADDVKYKTASASGGLVSPWGVLTNSHVVLERGDCTKYNETVSALQVAPCIQGVSGTKARPGFFATAQARRLLVASEELQEVDQVKYAEAKVSKAPSADALLKAADDARTHYGTAGLKLPRTADPVTGEYYTNLNVMDPDLALLTHTTTGPNKVPLGAQLVPVAKLDPTPKNSPFMLPSLLFDPELMARRGYPLGTKPALPIVFAGSPGTSMLRTSEPPEEFCPEYLKIARETYGKTPQEAAGLLKQVTQATFGHVHGVAFSLAHVALHKKKLVLTDTYVGHSGLTNPGFSGAKGTDPYAPLGTFQYVHCGPAEIHFVLNTEWADLEQERFGYDRTTQRVIPPPYNVAIPSHSPRFAVIVVTHLVRVLNPHGAFWTHPKFSWAASALPSFRRLVQYHLPVLVHLKDLGPHWKDWLQLVVRDRHVAHQLQRLDEDQTDTSTPDLEEFKALAGGKMGEQIAAYLGKDVSEWRRAAAQTRVRVVIAEFEDLFTEKNDEGNYQTLPYDLRSWPWTLPDGFELRKWADVLWLFRRLRGGPDTIRNYISKDLLAKRDKECLPPSGDEPASDDEQEADDEQAPGDEQPIPAATSSAPNKTT